MLGLQTNFLASRPNFNLMIFFILAYGLLNFKICAAFIGDRYHNEIACDGYELKMLCPATDLIMVQHVTYGRQDDLTCVTEKHMMTDTHCSLPNALDTVSKKCNGKSSCVFTIGQPEFLDPCPGTRKYANVYWDCVSATISCPGALDNVSLAQSYLTKLISDAAWVRDPQQHTQKIYYMSWSNYDGSTLYEYSSPQKLISNKPTTFHHIEDRIDGTGFVVSNGFLYYNKERSRVVIKYSLANRQVAASVELSNANYHGTSPYAIEMYTDIDISVDENGIWVVYATENNGGNIVLSRLQKYTLNILSTWYTSYEKLSALNAFVACGVLYVINYDTLEIDYIYNTSSNRESRVRIPVPGLNHSTSAVEYNPKDRKLYVWDKGVATVYQLHFEGGSISTASPPKSVLPGIPSNPITITTTSTTSSTSIKHDFVSSSIPQSNFPILKKSCAGREANGLIWPSTKFLQAAVLNCPGSKSGKAVWICEGTRNNPKWRTILPDMSQCTSGWISNLKEQFNNGRQSSDDLSQSLAVSLRKNVLTLTSWDIVELVHLLKHFAEDSTLDTSTASAISDATLKSTSEMLRPVLALTWKGLERKLQTATAVDLVKVLEKASFFLARDMTSFKQEKNVYTASSQSNNVTWSQPYATMAIRVEPVIKSPSNNKATNEQKSKNMFALNSGHGDSVIVNDFWLSEGLAVKPGDKLAIVYLSFKNIGNYIVDAFGFGSGKYRVDSKVILLSARSLGSDGSWKNSGEKGINLTNPVKLYLKHNINQYAHHACAFWNDNPIVQDEKRWWRAGCRRIQGNDSHTVCECNHLTSFSVLSSNEEIPLMGMDPNWETEPSISSFALYINVVRGGMIISVIFLLMTFISVFHLRSSSDLKTIRKNLIVSLFLTEVVFLFGITQISQPKVCSIIAAFLQYGVLCTFTWAALEPAHHLLIVKSRQDEGNKWKYYYIIGCLFPGIVVGISAAMDYSAFGTESVCWIRTSDCFIWAFIGPCCLAIATTVVLVAFLLYKLNKNGPTRSEFDSNFKTIRLDVASTCVIMFLLCMMWSSAFIWISGYQVVLTAWLFSIFSALTGVAFFLLYCIIPPDTDIFQRCPASCFTKHSNEPYDGRIGPNQGRPGNNEPLLIPYTAGRITQSTRQLVHDDLEFQPLVAQQNPADSSLGQVVSLKGWHGNRRASADNTEPKLHEPNGFINNRSSWNEYIRNNSIPLHDSNEATQANGNTQFRCCNRCNRNFSLSSSSQFCSCTTITYMSNCYDRLHDDRLPRSSNQSNKFFCSECRLQKYPNKGPIQKRPVSHIYETLGHFTDLQEERNQIKGYQLENRHPYEYIPAEPQCTQIVNSLPQSANDPRLYSTNFVKLERIREPCSCMKTDPPKRSARVDLNSFRNGRHSDPLSTDQGYDTDTQQQVINHNTSSCETNSRKSSPEMPGDTNLSLNGRRRSFLSATSENVSENDKEVEMITSSSLRRNSDVTCTSFSHHSYVTTDGQTLLCESHDNDLMPKPINESAFDTVRSWSAITGTRLKSSYPLNGPQVTDRKSTVKPQIILAQARQTCPVRNSIESCRSGCSDERTNNGYTLPGTAAAGTKARIDLRTGGVSISSNL